MNGRLHGWSVRSSQKVIPMCFFFLWAFFGVGKLNVKTNFPQLRKLPKKAKWINLLINVRQFLLQNKMTNHKTQKELFTANLQSILQKRPGSHTVDGSEIPRPNHRLDGPLQTL